LLKILDHNNLIEDTKFKFEELRIFYEDAEVELKIVSKHHYVKSPTGITGACIVFLL